MATSFRIKQLDNGTWIPNHAELTNTVSYTQGENLEISFSVIRESLFDAVNRQFPDMFSLDNSVDNHKEFLFSQIDKRTRDKIAEGFIFEGMTFSLSANAQTNYTAMLAAKELLTYPVTINTLDDSDNLALTDEEAVINFCGAALNAAREFIDLGSELKQEVRQATTTEQLDAIDLE